MRNQQEIVFHAVRLPVARRAAIVLLFDDELLQTKSGVFKDPHDFKRHRNHVTLLARVAHEDGAKFIFLKDAITFRRDLFHFRQKLFDLAMRQIFLDVLAVADNIGIGRMRANEIDLFIRNEIQMPRVSFADVHFAIGAFVLKIRFLSATGERDVIHVHTDDIAIQKFGFDQRRPASGKLIEDEIAFL